MAGFLPTQDLATPRSIQLHSRNDIGLLDIDGHRQDCLGNSVRPDGSPLLHRVFR